MEEIYFGTDGWRAIVGQGFDERNVRRVAHATARAFLEEVQAQDGCSPRLIVGYDTRADADRFARLTAEVVARTAATYYSELGLEVVLSDRYVPTPCLCWAIAHDERAIGGIQLTASHNPAQWLGLKVRMRDGGASPAEFTRRIENLLPEAQNLDSEVTAGSNLVTKDILTDYLDALYRFIDADAIRSVNLKIVVDPLYGAARGYLADTFERLGVQVVRVHDDADPTFGGLHPEPIEPWTDSAARAVVQTGAAAGFVSDGDADRLGALDEEGTFVSPHKIIALLAMHLVENRGKRGAIVKTLSTSQLVDRIGEELGVPVTTTPIGFKWIYAEMLAGDVLIGGEESGGIGIPGHVFERDGLLMSLLLAEMMAQSGQSLRDLVAELEARAGTFYYDRFDLTLDQQQIQRFRQELPTLRPATVADAPVLQYNHTDGAKFALAATEANGRSSDSDDSGGGEWLLLRASGTEPLVRIYAESATAQRTAELIAAGTQLVLEGT